jgi:hypothetical protein
MRKNIGRTMMAYDSECWNLAEYFLEDENFLVDKKKQAIDALAQQIQTCIEDFCQFDLLTYTTGLEGAGPAGSGSVPPPDGKGEVARTPSPSSEDTASKMTEMLGEGKSGSKVIKTIGSDDGDGI